MILAVDVGYYDDKSITAGITFSRWDSDCHLEIIRLQTPAASQYISGAFYQRELPCILALLDTLDEQPECILIDGYVTLGVKADPGLGMKLWDAINRSTPIIGVAKTRFAGTPAQNELLRGSSKMPLFITSAGLPLETAKGHVASMAGPYRMPTILKLADTESRNHHDGRNDSGAIVILRTVD